VARKVLCFVVVAHHALTIVVVVFQILPKYSRSRTSIYISLKLGIVVARSCFVVVMSLILLITIVVMRRSSDGRL
jgi:hypothetical protein